MEKTILAIGAIMALALVLSVGHAFAAYSGYTGGNTNVGGQSNNFNSGQGNVGSSVSGNGGTGNGFSFGGFSLP